MIDIKTLQYTSCDLQVCIETLQLVWVLQGYFENYKVDYETTLFQGYLNG